MSGVVLRVGNSRLPHESLARKTLDFVLRPRAVSIVGKLCQVVHGHNAELADFFECVNLGIPKRVFLVPVRILGSDSSG